MNKFPKPDPYGVLTEPTTLTLHRLLPGPIERVWAHLTQSELRGQWLARGAMDLTVGAPFEMVWRNDELSDPPGVRPEGFPEEHRMPSRILELEAPHRLTFSWMDSGEVSFTLAPRGDDVLLTVTHRRVGERKDVLMFGPGWHMHLDILVDRITGLNPPPFWEGWLRLQKEYDRRMPA